MNLRELREKYGYTQRMLAEDAGVSRRTISQAEKGRKPLGLTSRKLILDALGVPFEKHIEVFGEPPARQLRRHPLALHRLARGFTQERLAEVSTVSKTSIIDIEQGRRNPRMGTRKNLLDALGVPMAEHEKVFGPRPIMSPEEQRARNRERCREIRRREREQGIPPEVRARRNALIRRRRRVAKLVREGMSREDAWQLVGGKGHSIRPVDLSAFERI